MHEPIQVGITMRDRRHEIVTHTVTGTTTAVPGLAITPFTAIDADNKVVISEDFHRITHVPTGLMIPATVWEEDHNYVVRIHDPEILQGIVRTAAGLAELDDWTDLTPETVEKGVRVAWQNALQQVWEELEPAKRHRVIADAFDAEDFAADDEDEDDYDPIGD